jgi:membrane protease YdiL (CAAX protease family)
MDILLIMGILLALILLANLVERNQDKTFSAFFLLILLGINVPVLLFGLALWLVPPQVLNQFATVLPGIDLQSTGAWYALTAVAGLFVVLPPVRQAISRFTAIREDSAVHATALLLAVYLVGNTFSTLGQGGLEALAENVGSASIWQVVGQQLLFVAAGIAGIGLFVRRTTPTEIAQRLGLEIPSGRQLAFGFALAIVLVVVQFMVGALALWLTPDQIGAIEEINLVVLGEIDSLGEWFVLALSAGVGEEILFRGALQPIFGIPLTAILFTIAHVQYGFTIITLYFIILAVVLSLVRQRANTTTAIFVHFAYNFMLGLFSLLAPILEEMLPELEAIIINAIS